MENVQLACLFAGVVILLVGARLTGQPGLRVIFSGGALVYLTLFLLEFDVRPFKIPVLTQLLNGPVRNSWVSALWLLLLAAIVKHHTAVIPAFRAWVLSSAGILLMVAAGFWAAGKFAEELRLFASAHQNMFAEELMESHAALIMVLAAAEALRLRKALFVLHPN